MKNFIAIFSFIFLPALAFAQAPEKLSYQFIIRDNSGQLISEESVGVKITLLQGEFGENEVYVETHIVETNQNGAGSLEIGSGYVVEGSFSHVDWAHGPFSILAETDPDGGSNYQISGTSPILSVPYALYASNGYRYHAGQLTQGGIVFSVWKDSLGVEHGLVASLEDMSNGEEWGPTFEQVGANSASNGELNIGASIAGNICESYVYTDPQTGEVFDDWYLPAVWELAEMSKAAFIINTVLNNDNNPETIGLPEDLSSIYWSSTEVSGTFAWSVNITTSVPSTNFKDSVYKVRAIRRF